MLLLRPDLPVLLRNPSQPVARACPAGARAVFLSTGAPAVKGFRSAPGPAATGCPDSTCRPTRPGGLRPGRVALRRPRLGGRGARSLRRVEAVVTDVGRDRRRDEVPEQLPRRHPSADLGPR